ncbi:MAG TPA: DUF3108 domain-containing protein [Gallionella sp.]|nr:DUF3108 domain-containing protein [Gallionella sp.]
MIALPRTSTGKIALAIALSALVHAIVLFAPLVKLPPVEAPLPPLTAKLEPLPKIDAQPAPPRKPKRKPRPAPLVPKEAPPDNQPAESVSTEAPQIDHEPQQPQAIDETANKTVEEARPAHPLPKHAQLTFIAYKGTDFAIGEARHRLEIGDDKSYTLRVGMNTTGLASIFKTYESDQQSSGTLTAQGLRPNEFSETKNTSKGKESLEAKFAWEEKVLSFSNGHSTPLPEQAQDVVSFLYQLSQLTLDNGAISMYISNGKKLERYELTVGEEEMIQTRLGRLRALPLHKVHAQGEEGLDIWLGLEYRLLPVKLRMFDRSGQIAGEMVISEIRVSDE